MENGPNNKFNNYTNTEKNTHNEGYIKRYSSTFKSLINNEIHKDPDERSRDFKALILTIIIVSILIFIIWKVPFLHDFIFP